MAFGDFKDLIRTLSRVGCNHLLFFNHFEEVQTVLIEVKLIINSAPLTYVYPNAIKYV